MARGARRASSPHAGKLDLFFKAEISYALSRKSALHTLRELHVIEPFDASVTSCANVFVAGYFAELTDLITQPGEPVREIFGLLDRAIAYLRTQPAKVRVLEHFESELCRLTGIEHSLESLEAYCGRIPASRQMAFDLLRS